MSSDCQAFHLKYRPKSLKTFVGNEGAVETIKTILERPKEAIPRAWLFTGPSGCGKTTLVRILKKVLKCSDIDFYETNASNNRGIDTARSISEHMNASPIGGETKIFLLDEFHQMTGAAQEALLKPLEDAPRNTFFMLATTEPEKLKNSIKTRCTTIQLQSLTTKHITKLLKRILKKEKIKNFSKELIIQIAKNCNGSPRDAVKILDAVVGVENEELALEMVQQGSIEDKEVIDLCRLIVRSEQDRWPEITQCLKTIKAEPEQVRRAILGYLNAILMKKDYPSPRICEIMECFESNYYDTGKSGLTISCAAAFHVTEDDIPF